MGYAFKPDHPGYNLVTMRQLAMRYDAGEELASITTDLAVPSESTTQVGNLSSIGHQTIRQSFMQAITHSQTHSPTHSPTQSPSHPHTSTLMPPLAQSNIVFLKPDPHWVRATEHLYCMPCRDCCTDVGSAGGCWQATTMWCQSLRARAA